MLYLQTDRNNSRATLKLTKQKQTAFARLGGSEIECKKSSPNSALITVGFKIFKMAEPEYHDAGVLASRAMSVVIFRASR